ncbi:MAG: GerAB/ArcD/ProY family transporter [Clostridiaceae bacterium]|nr:GerAB/ArcD/ProY family transporter [Clostridiaceae bacterium]
MIINSNDKISTKQATASVTAMIIGAGILTMTRSTGKEVGTPDIWMSVILGGMLALTLGFVHVKLSQRFPGETFFQYSHAICGKFIGTIINLAMIALFILLAGFEARVLAELVRSFLLYSTPLEVLIISFLWVGAYLVAGGLNPLVRIFELFSIVMVLILTGILILGLQHFDINNLRPVLSEGIMPVIKGVKSTFLSYLGYEILLFITGFMKEPQKAMKAMFIGVSIPIFYYIGIAVIVTGVLTLEETLTLTWPTATFVNSIDYPGGFIENFQIFFIIAWVLAIYTTFSGALYIASMGIGQIIKKKTSDFICFLMPVIFLVSMIPDNQARVFEMGDLMGNLWLVVAGIIPLIMLVVAVIRKKGSVKKANE